MKNFSCQDQSLGSSLPNTFLCFPSQSRVHGMGPIFPCRNIGMIHSFSRASCADPQPSYPQGNPSQVTKSPSLSLYDKNFTCSSVGVGIVRGNPREGRSAPRRLKT